MIVELSPVESAKAILIGAGSKLFRPKCRHGGFLRKQEEDIINTTAPCTEHSIRSKVPYSLYHEYSTKVPTVIDHVRGESYRGSAASVELLACSAYLNAKVNFTSPQKSTE